MHGLGHRLIGWHAIAAPVSEVGESGSQRRKRWLTIHRGLPVTFAACLRFTIRSSRPFPTGAHDQTVAPDRAAATPRTRPPYRRRRRRRAGRASRQKKVARARIADLLASCSLVAGRPHRIDSAATPPRQRAARRGGGRPPDRPSAAAPMPRKRADRRAGRARGPASAAGGAVQAQAISPLDDLCGIAERRQHLVLRRRPAR